ncbi:YT521-B-like domain-containing protein [Mycena leptocephala]|nr:YT521-B-like domain-containing protein [Mycena leptocephala]
MYPQYMPAVGPHLSPHFFPGHQWPAPPLPQHHYGPYGAQHPSVYQPAQYSHPAHSFHAPREPPSASPITSTSVGAPVLPAGSSRGERRGGARGKVRECDSNKDRDKTKDKGKDIDCAKPLERQPYHPTPPVSRSDWVMWAGNVPRDARHDELWRFFTEGAGSVAHGHGILSIFLIARSACAFVNYSSSAALSAAIAQFDGVPLRAGYAGRALECRARDGDDNLRVGVGGQRGVGMHECWMRDRRREWVDAESGAHSKSERDTVKDKDASTLEASGSASPGGEHGSTSTSSSMLARHFPQRFFILKSLTREDLDLSVRTGVWATQHHNEGVLDRAFRTAADVVLIFSVNKSGEFYGWARCVCAVFSLSPLPRMQPILTTVFPIHRMEGPVGQGKAAAWAPRGDQATPAPTAETHTHTPYADPARAAQSAPALLARRSSARLLVRPVPKLKHSLDPMVLRELEQPLAASLGTEKEEMGAPADTRNRDGGGRQEGEGDCWGQNFALHWMCTVSLPFTRTQSLRNPWNHDRQVKVARDGTEIEPAVGHALIEQWSGSGAEGTLQGLTLG